MELDRLPDDCIFALLKPNFSLSKLIRLRAVNKKWKEVVEKICLSKTELNLFDALLDMVNVCKDADAYGLMKRNELKRLAPNLLTPSKTVEIAVFLSRLFPNVTKLVCGLEDSFQMALLLGYWSDSLEDVTIIGKLHEKPVRQLFWSALDSMPKLKRLVFHDITDTKNYQHIPYAYFVPPSVTVFKQLEHFSITGRANQVYDIFGYKKPKHGQIVAAVPLKRQNRALANLTHLVLTDKHRFTSGCLVAQPAVIKAILASTEALRHLDICDLDFNLTDLMPELMRKTSLESIRIKSSQLVRGDGVMRPNSRLNSVKRLHLVHTTVAKWLNTEKPNYRLLPVLFPSLEHLEVATKDAKPMKLIQAIMPRSVVLSFISNN